MRASRREERRKEGWREWAHDDIVAIERDTSVCGLLSVTVVDADTNAATATHKRFKGPP